MRKHGIEILWIALVLSGPAARAERALDAAELRHLLETLTSAPRKTWIPAGTMRVLHLEYRATEDFTSESVETFVSDGNRFRWEITRDEEIADLPPAVNSSLYADFNKNLNRHQLFCWDGEQYTRYYKSAGQAIVETNRPDSPDFLVGPFSAGIVPWGTGDYQLERLMLFNPSAVEYTQQNQRRIRLQLHIDKVDPPLLVTLLLDPDKNFAVLSHVTENEIGKIRCEYHEYEDLDPYWVPKMIVCERTDKRSAPPRLVSYEDWQVLMIRPEMPSPKVFDVRFENGVAVEHFSNSHSPSSLYYTSESTDISNLLEDKARLASSASDRAQNCATAAAGYILRRFSRALPADQLSAMVSAETGHTSFGQLKQTLENSGLYCMAVTTDLQTLRELKNCTALLHLSATNHYLILDHIDDRDVWTIDLTSRKFYWKYPIPDFLEIWKEGTALLAADAPQDLPVSLQTLEPLRMSQITGGDAELYSCSDQIQIDNWIPCPEPVGGFCFGLYYLFHARKGCIEDPVNGGICVGTGMIGYEYRHCTNDPYIFGSCTLNGTIYSRLIRACE